MGTRNAVSTFDRTGQTVTRPKLVARLRDELSRRSSPRLEMGLMVVCAGAAGFLSSVGMLALGLEEMGLRYGLAVGVAYATFLLLLAGWVRAACGRPLLRVEPEDALDAAGDVADLADQGFLPPGRPLASPARSVPAEAPPGSSWADVDVLDVDHPVIWLVLAAAALAGVLVSAIVVWSAPAFLAEVLLDALVSVGLYRRLRSLEARHWLATAVGRTWLPVLLVAAAFAVAGFLIQAHVSEATSIGGWWRHALE